MRVWIDQDLCTGDALCTASCPEVFAVHSDGLAYVRQVEWSTPAGLSATSGEPLLRGASGLAEVPDFLVDPVLDAVEACPSECIFIEVGES